MPLDHLLGISCSSMVDTISTIRYQFENNMVTSTVMEFRRHSINFLIIEYRFRRLECEWNDKGQYHLSTKKQNYCRSVIRCQDMGCGNLNFCHFRRLTISQMFIVLIQWKWNSEWLRPFWQRRFERPVRWRKCRVFLLSQPFIKMSEEKSGCIAQSKYAHHPAFETGLNIYELCSWIGSWGVFSKNCNFYE